jgi:predicted NACHT family NTPase
MKFFVISGAPSTGKTTSINKIAGWLTTGIITTDSNGQLLPSFLPDAKGIYIDFSIVISLHSRKIIIHSATDDEACMNSLIEKIKQNPDTEIIITSCRDIYWERDYFTTNLKPFATFFLESPLGKITRRNDFTTADDSYKDILLQMQQHILSNNPYNL